MGNSNVTIEAICERWQSRDRPLFKGCLIDGDGCCCAQGDILRGAGWDDDRLRTCDQRNADKQVAELLGISTTHSVLIRQINDQHDGCPQDVLMHPEHILGDQTPRILEFWKRMDAMTKDDWSKVTARNAARNAARDAAWVAAWDASGDAAWNASWVTSGDAAWVAAWATREIQGADTLRKQGKAFFFLPMFGINAPEELDGKLQ